MSPCVSVLCQNNRRVLRRNVRTGLRLGSRWEVLGASQCSWTLSLCQMFKLVLIHWA